MIRDDIDIRCAWSDASTRVLSVKNAKDALDVERVDPFGD